MIHVEKKQMRVNGGVNCTSRQLSRLWDEIFHGRRRAGVEEI